MVQKGSGHSYMNRIRGFLGPWRGTDQDPTKNMGDQIEGFLSFVSTLINIIQDWYQQIVIFPQSVSIMQKQMRYSIVEPLPPP